MALDPNIALQTRPINVLSAIQGGLQTGEMIRNSGLRDAILGNQVAQGQQNLAIGNQTQQLNQQTLAANEFAAQNNAIKLATAQAKGITNVLTNIKKLPIAERAGAWAQAINSNQAKALGFDTQKLMNQGISDQEIDQTINAASSFLQSNPALPAEFGKVDLSKFTPESAQKYQQTKNLSDLVQISEGGNENLLAIRKEARSEIRKSVGDLSKESSTLSTNYKKLQNLADEMRTGNRTAVSQGLVALVKLGDPTSVVKDSEMINALNNESPLAAVASLLASKGTSQDVISSVVRKIDPLSPDSVNVDDILASADAMLSPNIQSIQSRYSEAKNRSDENLSEEGIKSIFSGGIDERITGLSDLMPKSTGATAQQTQVFYDANGNAKEFVLSADGSTWEPIN